MRARMLTHALATGPALGLTLGLTLVGSIVAIDAAAAGSIDETAQVVEVAVHQTRTSTPTTAYGVEAADGDLEPVSAAEGQTLDAARPEVAAAGSPGSPASHRAYVAILDGQGTYSTRETDLLSTVDETLAHWVDESNGAIASFTRARPAQHFTSDDSCSAGTGADIWGLWDDADSKFADVSFAGTSGNHLIVLVPDQPSASTCVFGVGTIGTGITSGGLIVVRDAPQLEEALSHELGHNLSLEHARGEVCATTCRVTEYDNDYDVMGYSGSGVPPTLSTSERLQLGIVAGGEVQPVALAGGQASSTTTYALAARGATSGLRGLRVTDPVSRQTYFVDWRDGTGRDAGTRYGTRTRSSSDSYAPGLIVERLQGDGIAADLLSRTSGGRIYRSLLSGEAFATGGLSVRLDAIAGGAAQVTVTLASTPLPSPTPTPGPTVTPTPTPVVQPLDKNPADLPVSVRRPTISGKALPGRTLAARASYSPASADVAYTWFVDRRPIKGGRASLTIRRSWIGQTITVQVEAADDDGDYDVARSRHVKVTARDRDLGRDRDRDSDSDSDRDRDIGRG